MKIPLSWLKKYIDIGLPPAEIAKLLTSVGLEIDSIETIKTQEHSTDAVFEISLTPNLAHCQCVLGVARELAAATGAKVKLPHPIVKETSQEKIESVAKVTVNDPEKCPRYASRVVKNVKAGPSPDWLKERLEASGIRSVNNIVDITNFVLLEQNQPLHAFDYDLLSSYQIIVKPAKNDEIFTTLDGKSRRLSQEDLLICDAEKPVAIAGVMGGGNSEVSEKTVNVLIESAYFSPISIRRTSKRLGLQTDASKRFERGCDPNQVIPALERAAALMHEIAGGTVVEGIIDIKGKDFPPLLCECRLSRINQLLGSHLSVDEVETIFKHLNFDCHWDGTNTFKVKVPTYRVDIGSEIDLIEEVARIYGYDNISQSTPHYQSSQIPDNPLFIFEREVRKRLLLEGLQELLTCDLIGPSLLDIVHDPLANQENWVKVLNPTSIEQSILRTSLLPGLLNVVKYNVDHQNHDIQGFEIGRVHFKEGEHFREQSVAAVILTGKQRPMHWDRKPAFVDFYDLKGIIENILNGLGIGPIAFKLHDFKIFHTGRQATIFVGEHEIGSLGEVHPAIQRRLDVPQRVFFAELNLHELLRLRKKEEKMQDLPAFPSTERDLTLTLSDEEPVDKILELIRSVSSPLLERVQEIDIFRSDKLGEGKKNVTFRFVYRDRKKTIEQEVVDREYESTLSKLKR